MSFTVIAYYTLATPYVNEAIKLKASLEEFHEDYIFFPIESLGSWQRNTQAKAGVIKKALLQLRSDVLYIDVDAIIQSPLSFYRNNTFEQFVSLHWLDCKRWKIHSKAKRVFASGTMFFKYTKESIQLLDDWQQEMKRKPGVLDQMCLGKVLEDQKIDIHPMPVEYIDIIDLTCVENSVIKHYQASRRFRK